eukprot:5995901-Amphidinium_carterae.1
MGLLGGVSWAQQCRPDAAVWIHAMQRHAKNPRRQEAVKLNALTRFLKRHPSGMWYPRLHEPVCIVQMTDAAFKCQPEDTSGLAVRGSITLLVPQQAPECHHMDVSCHVLDFQSVKQKR